MSRAPFLALAACAFGGWAAAADGLAFGSSDEEDPSYVAWVPPPEYVSGTFGHKTMYLANVAIGRSGQTFRMLVDTGSWMLVVPSAVCEGGGCDGHSRFDSRGARATNETATVGFVLGKLSGHIFEDDVCVGISGNSAQLSEVGLLQLTRASALRASEHRRASLTGGGGCARMAFLVADSESSAFKGKPFDGILGLGLGGGPGAGAESMDSRFSFMDRLFAEGHASSSAFALRLGNTGQSELLLGGVGDHELAGQGVLWVPLSPVAEGHWQILISDLTLDGVRQHVGGMEVIVDSGTSLLAPDDGLKAWFNDRLAPESCATVDRLPTLGFRLDSGSVLSMLPSDYVDQRDGHCELALMPWSVTLPDGPRLILGDSFLRRYTAIFDRQNRRLGFGISPEKERSHEIVEAMFPGSRVPLRSGQESDRWTHEERVGPSQSHEARASVDTLPAEVKRTVPMQNAGERATTGSKSGQQVIDVAKLPTEGMDAAERAGYEWAESQTVERTDGIPEQHQPMKSAAAVVPKQVHKAKTRLGKAKAMADALLARMHSRLASRHHPHS